MRGKFKSVTLTVVTATGKANIPSSATHSRQLREWFAEAVPNNDPAFAADNHMAVVVYIFVGVVSLFAAMHLTENAGNAAMAIAALVGAVLGVVGSYFLIYFGSRLLKSDISYGLYGAIIGTMLGLAISVALGGSMLTTAAIALGGAFLSVRAARK